MPGAAKPNAVLLYSAAGFSTSGPRLMGINAAAASMVRGLARHAGVARLTAMVAGREDGAHFEAAVRDANPAQRTALVHPTALEAVGGVGALLLQGPWLAGPAWQRQALGAGAYSIVGVTHTTATPRMMDALTAIPAAPVQPWDAVVCTSVAVQRMVATLIGDQEDHLRERFRLRRGALPRPQLPVIPLGIDCAALRPAAGLRAAWRARLGLGEGDVVALYLGRLNHVQKAHPIPLFQAMAAAGAASKARLLLILAGWFTGPGPEAAFRAAAREHCPDVPVLIMDGRLPDVQAGCRAVADLFVSPVDNVQETFGLAPLEAMAAGLPVVVSDWDGYRDTVRDGIDGFRVPTLAAPPGVFPELALRFSEGGLDGYEEQVGAVGQAVAVDVPAMAAAVARLAGDAALRRRMGRAAQARARAFDWARVVPQYQALWAGLAALRRGAAAAPGAYPARPDPFHAFRGFATAELTDGHRVTRAPGDAALVRRLLGSPLVRPGPAPALLEAVLAASDGRTVGALAAELPSLLRGGPPRGRAAVYRAVLWLLKYGLVTATDDGRSAAR